MSKKEPSKLSQYQDPTGEFRNREFQLGFWYVKHKLLLRNIFIGVLTTWSVITIGIGLFVWGQYLFVGYWDDEDLLIEHITTFQNYSAVQPLYEARSLEFDSSKIFKSAEGRYDFFTPATNPNNNFLAHVDFHYVYGQVDTAVETLTLLPLSTQGLIVYGHESGQYPAQARMVIDAIRWERIDPHMIVDAGAYMQERVLFSIDNFSFTRPDTAGGSFTNELSFDIRNDSVYSFWEPTFQVLLKRGASVVGVIPFSEKEFRAGQSRTVKIYTFADVTKVDNIDVIPTVNVFERDVYIAVGE
jgi:hypothetical protein